MNRSLNRRDAMRFHMLADELNDVVHRSPRLENAGHADLLEAFNILIGDNAANQDQHVVHFPLLQQVHHARNDGVVRARENRESDDLHVFLQRGADDHLRSLPQAGVDDLHNSIAKGASDHLGAAVVAVEARLRYEYTDFGVSGHRDHLTTEDAANTVVNLTGGDACLSTIKVLPPVARTETSTYRCSLQSAW